MTRPARIELVIDEVVWHGGSEGDRRAFGAALERALAFELANPALQHALVERPIDVPSVDVGRVPSVTGHHVGRAVAGGLMSAARRPR